MGNIHLEQEQYAAAVKMFRMALDQLPPSLKRMRLNVQRNIGIAFLRAGRYQDAQDAFAAIMADGPDHQTAFNLVLCCWAMRDVGLMKQSFLQLVQVRMQLNRGERVEKAACWVVPEWAGASASARNSGSVCHAAAMRCIGTGQRSAASPSSSCKGTSHSLCSLSSSLPQIPPYIDDSRNDSEEELVPEDDPLQQELRQRQAEVDR